jgi:hypothetical protein
MRLPLRLAKRYAWWGWAAPKTAMTRASALSVPALMSSGAVASQAASTRITAATRAGMGRTGHPHGNRPVDGDVGAGSVDVDADITDVLEAGLFVARHVSTTDSESNVTGMNAGGGTGAPTSSPPVSRWWPCLCSLSQRCRTLVFMPCCSARAAIDAPGLQASGYQFSLVLRRSRSLWVRLERVTGSLSVFEHRVHAKVTCTRSCSALVTILKMGWPDAYAATPTPTPTPVPAPISPPTPAQAPPQPGTSKCEPPSHLHRCPTAPGS